jgi:ribonuclease R
MVRTITLIQGLERLLVGKTLSILKQEEEPVGLRRLLVLLGLPMQARRRVRRLLKELVQEGRVVSVGNGRFRLAGSKTQEIGTMISLPRGWAQVVLDKGQGLVRIHPEDRGGAFPGDRVRVQVTRIRLKDSSEGRVMEIVERGGKPFVGVLRKRGSSAWVLSEEAGPLKSVRVERSGAEKISDGMLVAVSVKDPLPKSKPWGVIEKVLGKQGELHTEISRLQLECNLERTFTEEVERETSDTLSSVGLSWKADREDMRHVPFITLDPEDAKDFDDAVSVAKDGKMFRLKVAVAHVSPFVVLGKETDREANRRGCSVYWPGVVFPMLPFALCEGMCSLVPKQERPALVVDMEITPDGKIAAGRVVQSVIRSHARLNYKEAQEALDGNSARPEVMRCKEQLMVMVECAEVLLLKMRNRGALDLDIPETEIVLGGDGIPIEVRPKQRHFSCRIIESFMIAANEAIAGLMRRARAPALYRVHPSPDPEKMENLSRMLRGLGVSRELKCVPSSVDLQALVHSLNANNTALKNTVSHLLLRSLMPACYRTTCDGHYGLASDCYLHFTSPIRRYPDLFVQRQVGALLDRAGTGGISLEGPLPSIERWTKDASTIEDVAAHSSEREREAMGIERKADALYHAAFMQNRVGETFGAVISFVIEQGLIVRVVSTGIEGLVHVSRMKDDFYLYHEESLELKGRRGGKRYTIGLPVRVRLVGVDLSRRQIDFELDRQGEGRC